MIISLDWLADYVQIPSSADALAEKLLMSGLNHESTERVGNDTAIDLEVTSNRPDCLGHIGVAREVALLFSRPLHVPDPRPLEGAGRAAGSVAVTIEAPELCPFYSARVVRGAAPRARRETRAPPVRRGLGSWTRPAPRSGAWSTRACTRSRS